MIHRVSWRSSAISVSRCLISAAISAWSRRGVAQVSAPERGKSAGNVCRPSDVGFCGLSSANVLLTGGGTVPAVVPLRFVTD